MIGLGTIVAPSSTMAQSGYEQSVFYPVQYEGPDRTVPGIIQRVNQLQSQCINARVINTQLATNLERQVVAYGRRVRWQNDEGESMREAIQQVWLTRYYCRPRG